MVASIYLFDFIPNPLFLLGTGLVITIGDIYQESHMKDHLFFATIVIKNIAAKNFYNIGIGSTIPVTLTPLKTPLNGPKVKSINVS
ncbi:unnamed protein product [Brugia timori]|uniref:Sulfate_transp domain-containing protein n=1 Tax=Brugia timori TaxID=42155 RepID=A0A0R3QAT9_9BILA|nr:unnamed protein product [Brugia timori]